MLRTILVGIYVVLLLIIAIPYLLIAKLMNFLGLIGLYNWLLESFLIFFGKSVLLVAGTKMVVTGLENIPKRSAMFVGNHQSLVDIPIMIGYVPGVKGFIAKKETAKLPIIKWWMNEIKCVFLDRHNIRQGMKDMAKAKELLQSGHSMIIYREGTRSRSEELGEFKKGSLKIAVQAGVPIVPVVVNGSYLVYEKNKKIQKATVQMVIGKPINIHELTLEEQKDISETVQKQIGKILNDMKTQKDNLGS